MDKSAREHIQDIQKKRMTCTENDQSFAELLDATIDTSLKGEQKIFFELIQNADDAGATEVTFHLISDQYLLISHNGTDFSRENVEKICNTMGKDQDKAHNAKKTGYKGIGFKSVFSVATGVIIFSGVYSFRFDKEATIGPDNIKPPLWQLVPIWTEKHQLLSNISALLTGQQTHFILTLKPSALMQNQITALGNEIEVLLFLRSIRRVTIKNHLAVTITFDKIPQRNQQKQALSRFELKRTAGLTTNSIHMLVISSTKTIDDDTKIALSKAQLTSHECPARIHEATETVITCAVAIDNGNFFKCDSKPLFSYLPTRVHCNLPIIINADFLLSLDRMALSENPWNAFLLHHAIYTVVEQLRYFATSEEFIDYRLKILHLLPERNAPLSLPSTLRTHYQNGYQQAVNNVAFLPSLEKTRSVLKLNKSTYHDATGFYQHLLGKVRAPHAFIDGELQEIPKTSNYISAFRFQDLVRHLLNHFNETSNPDLHHKMLLFLFRLTKNKLNLIESLKQLAIIPTTNHNTSLKRAEEVLFETSEFVKLSVAIDLHFLPMILFTKNSEFKQWLLLLGVREYSTAEIIKKYLNLIATKRRQLTQEDILNITTFICQHGNSELYLSLTEAERITLYSMPILTIENKWISANLAYLSDIYAATDPVEQYMTNKARFVSHDYLTKLRNPARWTRFFKEIGVGHSISVRQCEPSMDQIALVTPKGYRSPKVTGKFIFVDFIELITQPQFEDLVWSAVETLLEQYPSANFRNSILSYLATNDVCLSTCGERLASPQLFSPNLENLVDGAFYVANIPVSTEHLSRLDVKTSVSIEQCVDILKYLQGCDISKHTLTRFYATLRVMTEIYRHKKADKRYVLAERNNLALPAENNTLVPVANLLIFGIHKMSIGRLPCWLNQSDFTKDEKALLSDLFDITIIDRSKVALSSSNKVDFSAEIKDQLLNRLQILAFIVSDSKSSIIELTNKFSLALEPIHFFVAERLILRYKDRELQPVQFYVDHQKNVYSQISFTHPASNRYFCKFLIDLFELAGNDKAKHFLPSITTSTDEELFTQLTAEGYDESQISQAIAIDVDTPVKDTKAGLLKKTSRLFNTSATSPQRTPSKNRASPSASSNPDNFESETEHSSESPARNETDFLELLAIADTVPIEAVPYEKKSSSPAGDSTQRTASSPSKKMLGSSPFRPKKRPINDKQNKQTGDIGEKLAYRWLRHHYSKKYLGGNENQLCDTDLGFKFSGTDSKTQNPVELEVIWHNKNAETGETHDFTIMKDKTEKILEVKATTANTFADAHISGDQYREMLNFGNRYRLFRVYGVPKSSTAETPFSQIKFAVLKDPATFIDAAHERVQELVIKL